MFGGSVCASADLLPPAGEGWLSLAAVRDGNALPLGKPLIWGSWGYPQRLSPLPLTLLRRTASGSEKRSNSMRQPPRRRSTIRHGTAAANSQKTQACPKVSPNRRRHRYADPRRARRATAPERVKAIFSLPPGAAHSLFVKNKKRMGGASPVETAPCGSRLPGRQIAAPTASPEAHCKNAVLPL